MNDLPQFHRMANDLLKMVGLQEEVLKEDQDTISIKV